MGCYCIFLFFVYRNVVPFAYSIASCPSPSRCSLAPFHQFTAPAGVARAQLRPVLPVHAWVSARQFARLPGSTAKKGFFPCLGLFKQLLLKMSVTVLCEIRNGWGSLWGMEQEKQKQEGRESPGQKEHRPLPRSSALL